MAVKRFFGLDGVLHEVELPDVALPIPVNAPDRTIHQLVNPTNVDPNVLPVDAAAFPNLRPTDGAAPLTKFHDRIPGDGQGSGVGQKSGLALRDAWENNPDRIGTTQVDTVQSGAIGSRAAIAPPADADRKVGGSTASPAPADGEKPDESWTKAQLADYLGDEAPAQTELKEVFLKAALDAYETKQLA